MQDGIRTVFTKHIQNRVGISTCFLQEEEGDDGGDIFLFFVLLFFLFCFVMLIVICHPGIHRYKLRAGGLDDIPEVFRAEIGDADAAVDQFFCK